MDGLSGMSTQWFEICRLEDIPQRGARRLDLNGKAIGVFRTSTDAVYAIDNACPHLGGPLTEGIVHDCAVTCPLHSMVIDLETGAARGPDEGQVSTYPVDIREGRIFLNVRI